MMPNTHFFLSDHAHFCLEWENFEAQIVEKKKNVSSNFFFFNRAVYEIMWKNIVQRGSPRVRNEWWLPTATNTHTLVV